MAFGMVFLDESGHFNSTDYICMAGFIATDEGWNALCAGWRILLREKYKLPAIHMREIMSEREGHRLPRGYSLQLFAYSQRIMIAANSSASMWRSARFPASLAFFAACGVGFQSLNVDMRTSPI